MCLHVWSSTIDIIDIINHRLLLLPSSLWLSSSPITPDVMTFSVNITGDAILSFCVFPIGLPCSVWSLSTQFLNLSHSFLVSSELNYIIITGNCNNIGQTIIIHPISIYFCPCLNLNFHSRVCQFPIIPILHLQSQINNWSLCSSQSPWLSEFPY